MKNPQNSAYASEKSRPCVVTIGGGTGHFMLLSGLKEYPLDITAIVSMADDGGSTGLLRDELGVLPPGDVRQCLVALSETTPVMRELFTYRFERGGLSGHSFGNLFLSALEKITGSFTEAIREASHVLRVRGEVIPVTESNMRLQVHLKDGSVLRGEMHLNDSDTVRSIGVRDITLEEIVRPNPVALARIHAADVIVIAPGDLYGSIVPGLLIPEVARAINTTKAEVLYVANLTNKTGQTDGFDATDYAEAINRYLGKERIDIMLCNNKRPRKDLIKRYETKEGKGTVVPCVKYKEGSYRIVNGDFLTNYASSSKFLRQGQTFIRHDSGKLAGAIVDILTPRL